MFRQQDAVGGDARFESSCEFRIPSEAKPMGLGGQGLARWAERALREVADEAFGVGLAGFDQADRAGGVGRGDKGHVGGDATAENGVVSNGGVGDIGCPAGHDIMPPDDPFLRSRQQAANRAARQTGRAEVFVGRRGNLHEWAQPGIAMMVQDIHAPGIPGAPHVRKESRRYGNMFRIARRAAGHGEHQHVLVGRQEGGGLAVQHPLHVRAKLLVGVDRDGGFVVGVGSHFAQSVVLSEGGLGMSRDKLRQERILHFPRVLVRMAQ